MEKRRPAHNQGSLTIKLLVPWVENRIYGISLFLLDLVRLLRAKVFQNLCVVVLDISIPVPRPVPVVARPGRLLILHSFAQPTKLTTTAFRQRFPRLGLSTQSLQAARSATTWQQSQTLAEL